MPPSPERRTILRPLPLARHTSPGFPPRGTVWVVERLGRFSRLVYSAKGAPLLPLLDKVIAAFSTRRIDYTTPAQGLLLDTPHQSLRIHALWHFRVSDPKRLAYRISDVDRCLDALVHSRLRDTLNAQPIDPQSAPLLQRMSDTVRAGVDVTSQKFGVTCLAFRITSIQPTVEDDPSLPSAAPPSQVKSLVLADALHGGVAENDLGEVESVLPELPAPQRAPPPVLSDSPDDDSPNENNPLPQETQRDVLYAPPPSPTDPIKYQPANSDILPELLGRVMNRRQQFDQNLQRSDSDSQLTSTTMYAPTIAKYLDTLPPTPHLDLSSNDDSDPQDEVEVFASRTVPANRPAPIPVNLSDDDHPLFRGDYPQPLLHTECFTQRAVEEPIAKPPSPPPLPQFEEPSDAPSEQTSKDPLDAPAPTVPTTLLDETPAPPSSPSATFLPTTVAATAVIAPTSTALATGPIASTPAPTAPTTPTTMPVEASAIPTPTTATVPAPVTIAPYDGVPRTPMSYNGMPPPPPPAPTPASAFPQLPATPYSGVLSTPAYSVMTPLQQQSTIVQSMQLSMGPSQYEGSSISSHRDVLGPIPYDALSLAQFQRSNLAAQSDSRIRAPLRNDANHQQLQDLSLVPYESYELPQMEIKAPSLSDITTDQSRSTARDLLLQHDNPVPTSTQDLQLPRSQAKAEGATARPEASDAEFSSTDAVRDEEMVERGEKRTLTERPRATHAKSSSSRQEARKRRGQVPSSNPPSGTSVTEKSSKSTRTVLTSDFVDGPVRHVKSQGSTQHSAAPSDKVSEVRRKSSKSQSSSKSSTREAPRRTEREKKRFAGNSESVMSDRGRPSWAANGRTGGSGLDDSAPEVGPEGGRGSRPTENSRHAEHDTGNSVAKEAHPRPTREKDSEWLRSKEEEEMLSHKEHIRRGKLMDVLESIEKCHAGNTAVIDHDSSGDESASNWADAASDSDSQFFGKGGAEFLAGSMMEVSSAPPRRRSKSRSHHKKEAREASSKADSSSDDGVCRECDHHHRHYSHHSESHSSRSRSHSRRVQMEDDEEGDASDHISEHRSGTSRSGRSRAGRRGSEEGRRSDHSSRDRSHRSKKSSRERKSERERDHSSSKSNSKSGDKKHSHQKVSSKSRKSSSRDGDYERKKSKSKSKSNKPRRPADNPTVYTYADPNVTPIYRHRLPLSEEEVVHPIPWYCEGQSAPEDTTDPELYPDRRSSEEDSRFDSLQTSTTTFSSYGQRDRYGRRTRARHKRRVTFLYDNL